MRAPSPCSFSSPRSGRQKAAATPPRRGKSRTASARLRGRVASFAACGGAVSASSPAAPPAASCGGPAAQLGVARLCLIVAFCLPFGVFRCQRALRCAPAPGCACLPFDLLSLGCQKKSQACMVHTCYLFGPACGISFTDSMSFE